MNIGKYPLLDDISTPADMRKLDESQLPQVASELRAFLLDTVSKSGGHFGAGLAALNLPLPCTIAMKHQTTGSSGTLDTRLTPIKS